MSSSQNTKQLRVLDLFCGMGGWSQPFVEDGDDVYGIDIEESGFPGEFIKQDIRTLDGARFPKMDLVIGSPPCTEFTIAWPLRKAVHGIEHHPEKGIELVKEFYRVVNEARPRFWAMENVSNMEKWWPEKPIWRFKISVGGRRSLWGSLPIPLASEFTFKRSLQRDYWGSSDKAERARIPYPIARFVADATRKAVFS